MSHFPLVEVTRGSIVESLHYGSFAVVDSNGEVIISRGDVDSPVYLRSSAKPFQALAVLKYLNRERYEFSLEEVALSCASHVGTEVHASIASGMLKKINLSENTLLCGLHPPVDSQTKNALIRSDRKLNQLYNNCSGKHAAMLALALSLGEDVTEYLKIGSKTQNCIFDTISKFSGIASDKIIWGIDGCSAPNFALPLTAAAKAVANLIIPKNKSEEFSNETQEIVTAMTSFPEIVRGKGEFDAVLMQAGKGKIISKLGAEGFQIVGVKKGDKAFGLALKITDGDPTHRAAFLSTIQILSGLELISKEQRLLMSEFDTRRKVNLRNIDIGEIRPCFRI